MVGYDINLNGGFVGFQMFKLTSSKTRRTTTVTTPAASTRLPRSMSLPGRGTPTSLCGRSVLVAADSGGTSAAASSSTAMMLLQGTVTPAASVCGRYAHDTPPRRAQSLRGTPGASLCGCYAYESRTCGRNAKPDSYLDRGPGRLRPQPRRASESP